MKRSKNIFFKYALFTIFVVCLSLWPAFRSHAGVYSVHVASFKTLQQAQSDISRLQALGYEAFIREADVKGSGKWHRVYVGKFNTHQKAAAAAESMKNKKQIETVFVHMLPDIKLEGTSRAASGAEKMLAGSENAAVVGNTKSKRYHLPGMPFYGKVKKHHRILFSSEKEAVDRGYYKAGTGKDESENKVGDTDKPSAPPPKSALQNAVKRLATASVEEQLAAAKSRMASQKALTPTVQEARNKTASPPPPPLAGIEADEEKTFKEPNEKDIVEPVSNSAVYNQALNELKEKKFAQALITFKEFISRDDTSKEWGQRALRHMADCHYWLGQAGVDPDQDKEQLLIAAEFYKNTLESFPDPRKENALTYYRLAKTYERLKYYPESIKQFQNLIRKYPDAPYVPEAYYKIGEINYVDGKYGPAAEGFIQYLLKYRGKANTKKSYYLVAHSFYKDKQSSNAEIWFRDIVKKWPDLMAMPKDMVLDYGLHKISMLRYDEAANAFSFYVNMYPSDPKNRELMMSLAAAYSQGGQISAALAVYQKIIRKYPGTKEAGKSMLAMAALGVDKPGAKVFRSVDNIENYLYPMDTYDDLIMKNATGDIAEEAMLQKAAALVKKGQGRRAADFYLEFLSLFPESKRIPAASRGLKSASTALIDEYYAKKDYLAVAYVYFRSFGAVALQDEEYPQISKVAFSLKQLNLLDDYSAVLGKYLKVAKDESVVNRVTLDLAEGLIAQGRYDDAEKMLTGLMNKPSVKKTSLITGIKKNLADIAYKKNQYEQAVSNYGAVVQSGQELQDPGKLYTHYAKSLKEQKDSAQALQNYLTAVKYLSSEKREKGNVSIAYKEIGDLYVNSNNLGIGLSMYAKALDNATDADMKFWSQFLVGKTYLELDRQDQAQNVFAQMKAAAGPEGFWAKVVDFYIADTEWWDKYGNLVKK